MHGLEKMANFRNAYDKLFDLMQTRRGPGACERLTSLLWTVQEAPDEGLRIAEEAAEQLKRGRCMDEDLVQDADKTFRLCVDCQRRTHFALESTVRYLHAAGDLVAQVVNDALVLEIGEGECTLKKVAKVVGAVPVSDDGERSGVARALGRLRCSNDYRYVANATNRMKHRNALQSSVRAWVTENDEVDVRQHLSGFEHKGQIHDQTEAAEVRLRVEGVRGLVADVLEELSRCLG